MVIYVNKLTRLVLSTNGAVEILREKVDVTDHLDVTMVAQPLPIRCNDWPIMTWGRKQLATNGIFSI